jgi:hypothetical protein
MFNTAQALDVIRIGCVKLHMGNLGGEFGLSHFVDKSLASGEVSTYDVDV